MDPLRILLHTVTLSLLVVIFLVLIDNLRYIRQNNRLKVSSEDFPPLSVLIPVRNEEKKISRCLLSVLEQDYPSLEILIYNDHSEDRTDKILKDFAGRYRSIRIIDPLPLPSGWMGKNFACHQLSRYAKGELLLFMDADTFLEKEALRKAIGLMALKKADLLSFIPRLEMGTFPEKMMLPLIPMAFLSFLPLRLVETSEKPELSGALGPFMLFRKSIYKKIGGHFSIAPEIVDDLSLARLVKEKGGKVVLLDGREILTVKFYDGFKEIWNGFTKSAFGAFNYSLLRFALFISFAYGVMLYPVLALFETLFLGVQRPDTWFLVAEVGLIYGFRALPDLHYGHEARWLPFFPLSMFLGILVALNSLRWALFKKGVVWKDRFYFIPKAGGRG